MQAATIIVKRSKGHIVVLATGHTPRGQRFVKGSRTLKATRMTDPGFKAEMAAAVNELIGSES